jgi:hypothetical protein
LVLTGPDGWFGFDAPVDAPAGQKKLMWQQVKEVL